MAGQEDLSRLNRLKSGDSPEDGGLPAARRTQQAENLSFMGDEGDVAHGRTSQVIGAGDSPQLQDGGCRTIEIRLQVRFSHERLPGRHAARQSFESNKRSVGRPSNTIRSAEGAARR
jgi:hypothetical protein